MKDFTEIVVLLDRSGSMGGFETDTIGQFNKFVEDQAKIGDNASVTLHLFDDQYETIMENVGVNQVKKLTPKEYFVKGTTALNDAMGKTIDSLGERLSKMNEGDRPNKIVIMTITDGHENASKEFSTQQIKDKVKHQEEKYNWQFLFLGANVDAFTMGAGYGLTADKCFNYSKTLQGANLSRGVSTQAIGSYRTGTTPDCNFNQGV